MSCMQAQQPRPSSSYFPNKQETEKTSKHNTRESNDAAVVQPFHFPPTKQVWWDRKAQGSPEILHLTSKRNLRVQLNEKTLRLGIKHLNKSSIPSYDCFFIGSLFIDSREDAVEINIDRFDPGREFTDKGGFKTKVPTTVVPGDQVIPLKLVKGLMGAQQTATHSKQDFQKTFELLHSRFSGQEQLSLSNFISTKACCYAHTEAEELILNIQVGAVTMATSILATPVSPVPIIPTALARNLTGPLRLSDVQGVPKCGFLTMDHTRKLLLLLESDPKAYSLPLVGVWVSGPFTVHHPYIWACCIRFLHCRAIKERSLVSANTFLLVHYSPAQTKPIFWECTKQPISIKYFDEPRTLDQMQTSPFDLLSCYENLHLDQVSQAQYPEPMCFELLPSKDTMNQVLFNQAFTIWSNHDNTTRSHAENLPITADNGPVEPRPSPSPYPQAHQGKLLIVPEVSLSLSFEESGCLDEKSPIPHAYIPKNITNVLSEAVSVTVDQENKAPDSLQHRHPGKQAVITKASQREPLRTITAQQVNTPRGVENRQASMKRDFKNIEKDSRIRPDETQNKNIEKHPIGKNGAQKKTQERKLQQFDDVEEKVQFSSTTKNKYNEDTRKVSGDLRENDCVEEENLNQARKTLDNSELCDSGVEDSSKDASFPEESETKGHQRDPYELIMKQEQQIKELQQQINLLLLQQSLSHFSHNGIPTPPPTPVTANSSYVSPLPKTPKETVSTNTEDNGKVTTATSIGSSLLLRSPVKTCKVSAATSPMKIQEKEQDLASESFIEIPKCSSSKCVTSDPKRASNQSLDSHRLDQTIDADELVVSKLDDTNQTLASSIHAVDICEFSPEPSTRQCSRLNDSSPVLGESASMLLEGQASTKSANHQYDSLLLKNEKQFYDNLLNKVKELLCESPGEGKTTDSSTKDNKSRDLSAVHVPTREEVIQATVQELARLKDNSVDDVGKNTFQDRQSKSFAPNDVISGLPRLHYPSMSINERMGNSVLQLNPLDAEYLSQSQIDEYRHLVNDYCSDYGQGEGGGNSNATNCTWNDLSSATQDYLQRYNLNGRVHQKKMVEKSVLDKSKASIQCNAPPSTPEPPSATDRILDIERLRNLPKLL